MPLTDSPETQYRNICIAYIQVLRKIDKLWRFESQLSNTDPRAVFDKLFTKNESIAQKIMVLRTLLTAQIHHEFNSPDMKLLLTQITNFFTRFNINDRSHTSNDIAYNNFIRHKNELVKLLRSSKLNKNKNIYNIIEDLIDIFVNPYDNGSAELFGLYSIDKVYNRMFLSRAKRESKQAERYEYYKSVIHSLYLLSNIFECYNDISDLTHEEQTKIQTEGNELKSIYDAPIDKKVNKNIALYRAYKLIALIAKNDLQPTLAKETYLKIVIPYFLQAKLSVSKSDVGFLTLLSIDPQKLNQAEKNVLLELICRHIYLSQARHYISQKLNGRDEVLDLLKRSFVDEKYPGNPRYNEYILGLIYNGFVQEADNVLKEYNVQEINKLFKAIIMNLITRSSEPSEISFLKSNAEHENMSQVVLKILNFYLSNLTHIQPAEKIAFKESIARNFAAITKMCNMNIPEQKQTIQEIANVLFSESPHLLVYFVSSELVDIEILEKILIEYNSKAININATNSNPYLIIAKNASKDSFELFYKIFQKRNSEPWKSYWSNIGNQESSILIYLCLGHVSGDSTKKIAIMKEALNDEFILKNIGENLFFILPNQHNMYDPIYLNSKVTAYLTNALALTNYSDSIKSIISDKNKLWILNPVAFKQKNYYSLDAHDEAKAAIAQQATKISFANKLASTYSELTEESSEITAELNIFLIILKKYIDDRPNENTENFERWVKLVEFCKMENSVYVDKVKTDTPQSFSDFKREFVKMRPDFMHSTKSINMLAELMDSSKYDPQLGKIINVLSGIPYGEEDLENATRITSYNNDKLRKFIKYCAVLVTEDIDAIGNSKHSWNDRLNFLYELDYEAPHEVIELARKASEMQSHKTTLLQLTEQPAINEAAEIAYKKALLEYQNRMIQQFVHAIDTNIYGTINPNGGVYGTSCIPGIYTRFMRNIFEVHHDSPLINRNTPIESILKEKFSKFVKDKFKTFTEKPLSEISETDMSLLNQYDALFSINENTWPQIYINGYVSGNDAATIQRFSSLIDTDVQPSDILLKDLDRIRTALLKECFGDKKTLLKDLLIQLPANMRHALTDGEIKYISYMTKHLFQDDQFMLDLAPKLLVAEPDEAQYISSYFRLFAQQVTTQTSDVRKLKEYLKNAILDVLIPQTTVSGADEIVGIRNNTLDKLDADGHLDNFNKCLTTICSVKYNSVLASMFVTSEKSESASVLEFLKSFSEHPSVDTADKQEIATLLGVVTKVVEPMKVSRLTFR